MPTYAFVQYASGFTEMVLWQEYSHYHRWWDAIVAVTFITHQAA